ncbi:ATP-dependent DNA helicase [Quisquiliibacterium transsilvanicum]|uniref:ATP-dependent DNA helicase DinG n=1 Tax=Quisquiliibacterium transsilvanicum TaxID=1549638 RepID=A0A7W8HG60_9BURK|nr:ATP-dependent DNA helicase [Quisquiliibacterium transsilvanicum]MBB5270585.1 ATP-dependent DNA helicase DinG [Quisquiliibacterium transsilvanicum]
MSGIPDAADGLAGAVANALGAQGPLAREHAGYVVRDGQLGLADAVAQAIDARSALVAEAGTGTGKTFSYLVPALLSGARVLISTGTRNLQDQLFHRDLPELARLLDVRVDTALLKGRANYVCWHHLQRNLSEGRFARREDIADLHRIQRFAVVSQSGDRSDFPGVAEEAPAWTMATSTRENCLGQDCPELARCFVFKARQAAQRAEVVVVNHHLFCADLALRDEGVADLLPTADALIFDEAHQLPAVATAFFGMSVSTRRILDFARDLLRAGLAEARDGADWTALSRGIEQALRELRLHAGTVGRMEGREALGHAPFVQAIDGCSRAIAAAGAALERAAERGKEVQRCALRATELCSQLQAWLDAAAGAVTADAANAANAEAATAGAASPDPVPDAPAVDGQPAAAGGTIEGPTVTWVEVHGASVTLHATPLSVAPVFRRHLSARPRAWVFLSATLAVGGAFGHFVSAMGLEEARQLVWESPFDYANQALLYVPQGIGLPAGADFAARVASAIRPLLAANGGRAFVLCTTLRMVDQLAGLLDTAQSSDGSALELLVQGRASRAELLDRFRVARAPVLIGSASFWEGVDVPGRQLSLVIIDKLPFAPPDDPVLRARIDAARRAGADPFRTLQLPAAAMALKQGAGRLIRSEEDRGVLVVCDARLAEKSYGRTLLRSLPPFRRTRAPDEVLGFIEGIDLAEAPTVVPG